MRTVKQTVIAAAAFLLLCTMIAGCAGSTKLADCFDKAKLEAEAKEIITIGEAGDYQALTERFAESLSGALTEEAYQQYLEMVKKQGTFQAFGSAAIVGQHVKETDSDYAAVVVKAEYENGKLQYVVGFDEDMHVVQYTVK